MDKLTKTELAKHEQHLKDAQNGFLRSCPHELIELAYPIYAKEFPQEFLQKNCGSCVHKVINWVASQYFQPEPIKTKVKVDAERKSTQQVGESKTKSA